MYCLFSVVEIAKLQSTVVNSVCVIFHELMLICKLSPLPLFFFQVLRLYTVFHLANFYVVFKFILLCFC